MIQLESYDSTWILWFNLYPVIHESYDSYDPMNPMILESYDQRRVGASGNFVSFWDAYDFIFFTLLCHNSF